MTPEEWQQAKEILQAALALEPAQRCGYLDEACVARPAQRREVESLILSYEQANSRLETPLESVSTLLAEEPRASWVGRRLGAYEVVEQIGEGGMGAVFRAVRADEAYQKQVAIKLVRSGFDTEFFLRRFKTERQILARLDHPNIARVVDGGATGEGLPYVVMEYVDGLPISTRFPPPNASSSFALSARQCSTLIATWWSTAT